MEQADIYDCVIVGGGPGGLTAAEYLGRFLRKTLIVDSGKSRAALIPETYNYPGFPEGISGRSLLQKLREQAENPIVTFYQNEVTEVVKNDDSVFEIFTGGNRFHARTVIAASGIIDDKPRIPGIMDFIYDGVVRFCPVCDGFEAIDRRVGIIGPCARICKKAAFMRTYTARIELFPLDRDCDAGDMKVLHDLGMTVPDKIVKSLIVRKDGVTAMWEDGRESDVDILYPAMGAKIRTDFLKKLDVGVNDKGCVFTDAQQQTNIQGLYAIGDVTLDLSQISVAVGQAAIAATHIHNTLPANCRPS